MANKNDKKAGNKPAAASNNTKNKSAPKAAPSAASANAKKKAR